MALRTKKDFIKVLAEAGYEKKELETLSLGELKDLYNAEKKTPAPVGASFEGVSSSGPQGRADSCDVYNMKTAGYVRTYSERIHGKEYRRLAKQFCEKNKDCFIKE